MEGIIKYIFQKNITSYELVSFTKYVQRGKKKKIINEKTNRFLKQKNK